MDQFPYKASGEIAQPRYHVIPDNTHGGWFVYTTSDPQEPQIHFQDQKDAIAYAEKMSLDEGVGFVVEDHEAPSIGI